MAIEDVLGTTAGTSVLNAFAVGDVPVRSSVGSVLNQGITVGTIGTLNSNLGTIGTVNTNLGTIGTLVAGTQPIVVAGTYTTVNSIPGSALSTNAVLLGYSSLTGTQTLTSEAILSGGTLAVTNPSGSRRIKLTLFIANVSNNAANAFSSFVIKEGAGTLQTIQKFLTSAGNGETTVALWSGTASAGVHTYTAAGAASSGTITIVNNAQIVSFLQAEVV